MSRNFTHSVLTGAAIALFFWLSLRFLLPIALPFALGIYLALAAEPGVRILSNRIKLPRPAASAVAVSVVFLLTVTILLLLAGFLMRQLVRLRDVLPQLENAVKQGLSLLRNWLASAAEKLPESLHNAVDRLLSDSFSGSGMLGQQAAQKLPEMATGLLSRLSSGLFGLLTGIISGYMLSARLPKMKEKLHNSLPEPWQNRYLPALKEMRKALGGWLLAEVKLAGVAFILLLLGFWVLRIDDSLLLAGLITIVDAFPVLGVGTVLIPWSLVCLLQQNYARGLGILGLYAAIWLIRSILEPKLVGKGLGLDPLVTLVAIYAGWKFFGIPGMLLAPILAMTGTQIVKALRR